MFLSQQRCSEASGKSGTTVQPTLPLEIHFESLFPLNRDSSFPVYVSGRSQEPGGQMMESYSYFCHNGMTGD